MIDLSQIKCLSIVSLDELIKYCPLKSTLPQLRELSIKNLTMDMIVRIDTLRCEQIYKLEVSVSGKQNDYISKELSILFPNIQKLTYKFSSIQSKDIMTDIIDRFPYLSNVTFYTDTSFYQNETDFRQNPNSIAPFSRQLTKKQFTCRINYPDTIHFWIGDEQESYFHALKSTYWLPRRGYRWYRSRYILSRILYNNILPCIKFSLLFCKQLLIYLLLIIVSKCLFFISSLFFQFFNLTRKLNVYLIFLSIIFIAVISYTFIIILFPFIIKYFINYIIQ